MSQIANPLFRFPGLDKFEAIEFDATKLNNEKDAEQENTTVSFLTSSGQRLTLTFKSSAAAFTQLATWATEVATKLAEQARP